MSPSALRGLGSALALLVALALASSPSLAQQPPPDGTGGAAGNAPSPPAEMRSMAPQPMNAPPAEPADTMEGAAEEHVPDAGTSDQKEDVQPSDGSGAEQPR